MNEFDRFLEIKLRQMLDPVAMSQPPARRGRLKRPQKPILAIVPAVGPAPVEFAAEAIPVPAAPQL